MWCRRSLNFPWQAPEVLTTENLNCAVKNFVVDKNKETKEFRYDYRGQSFSQAQGNS